MRTTKTLASLAGAALTLALAACGGDDEGDSDVQAASDLSGVPGDLADSGSIKIGVKYDQPGIGNLEPGSDVPEGFDIEVGTYIAERLGLAEDDVEWVETISDNREKFIQNGTVDLVIASYSITEERLAIVGQAGPYYVTGQQLLVRDADKETITGPDDLKNIKVCSVEGSTSLTRVEEEYGAKPVPFGTYSECVTQLENETVDAVTTDGAILLGYAAQKPDELAVVGPVFSEERYGIGYEKDAEGMCEFLKDSIEAMVEDGAWEEAFNNTLGESGVEAPEEPTPDPCP